MNAEPLIFNVQNPIHTGGQGPSAPLHRRVFPLGDIGGGSLRTGDFLPGYVHAVRSVLWQPDQTDDAPLPNGLQRDILPEIHLASALHLQTHIFAPLEKLDDFSILSWPRRFSPRHRKDVQIPQRKILGDGLL